jgi:hypothetical protein
MSAIITRERPDTPDAVHLITELEAHLAAHYPAESRHGFSVETIGLYERMGFTRIPPFGPYTDDPLSRCYEKRLT